MELNQRRKTGGRRAGREEQSTFRFYIGWKHLHPAKGHQLITANKGGGTHHIDIDKHSSFLEVDQIVTNLFFPGGKNDIQKLNLQNISKMLCTFSGYPIGDPLPSGERFTAEAYYRSVATHPVRIYLHTEQKGNEEPEVHN